LQYDRRGGEKKSSGFLYFNTESFAARREVVRGRDNCLTGKREGKRPSVLKTGRRKTVNSKEEHARTFGLQMEGRKGTLDELRKKNARGCRCPAPVGGGGSYCMGESLGGDLGFNTSDTPLSPSPTSKTEAFQTSTVGETFKEFGRKESLQSRMGGSVFGEGAGWRKSSREREAKKKRLPSGRDQNKRIRLGGGGNRKRGERAGGGRLGWRVFVIENPWGGGRQKKTFWRKVAALSN